VEEAVAAEVVTKEAEVVTKEAEVVIEAEVEVVTKEAGVVTEVEVEVTKVVVVTRVEVVTKVTGTATIELLECSINISTLSVLLGFLLETRKLTNIKPLHARDVFFSELVDFCDHRTNVRHRACRPKIQQVIFQEIQFCF
jgi:hypothetical protein